MANVGQSSIGGREPLIEGHISVERLPAVPEQDACYRLETPADTAFTNNLFRFPAKFHPPVVRWAIEQFGKAGPIVDPFNGSGTVQVEALARGMSSIGLDIDPLACLIAKAKTTVATEEELRKAASDIKAVIDRGILQRANVVRVPGGDIDRSKYQSESRCVRLPAIPRIEHWFRRYVIIDLAQIRDAILATSASLEAKAFLLACYAAIVRRVSNADPSPVSGVEVTRIQQARNARRCISVFEDYWEKLNHEIEGVSALHAARRRNGNSGQARVFNASAEAALPELQSLLEGQGVPLLLTSPPYCTAVDYSRRHRLEMFWLDFVMAQDEFISLKHRYIGRPYVRVSDESTEDLSSGILSDVQTALAGDSARWRTVRSYFAGLRRVFVGLKPILRSDSTVVCVIGDSTVGGVRIATGAILSELLSDEFQQTRSFSYAIRNFSMQYGLRNGVGIRQEQVLIFRTR